MVRAILDTWVGIDKGRCAGFLRGIRALFFFPRQIQMVMKFMLRKGLGYVVAD